ncbi:MAG: hypothetical protein HYX48_07430 [Chlamydiales bacterium]|nr:hypothetical protein [Chlamydiales bacterium]
MTLSPAGYRAVQNKLHDVLQAAADEAPRDQLVKLYKKPTHDGLSYLPIHLQSRVLELFSETTDLQARVKAAFNQYYHEEILEPAVVVPADCRWKEFSQVFQLAAAAGLTEEDLKCVIPAVINGRRCIFVGDTHQDPRYVKLRNNLFVLAMRRDLPVISEPIAREDAYEELNRKMLGAKDAWIFGIEDPVIGLLNRLVINTAKSAVEEATSSRSSVVSFLEEILSSIMLDPLFVKLWQELAREEEAADLHPTLRKRSCSSLAAGVLRRISPYIRFDLLFPELSQEIPKAVSRNRLFRRIDAVKDELLKIKKEDQFQAALAKEFKGRYSFKEVKELFMKLSHAFLNKYEKQFTQDECQAMRSVLLDPTNAHHYSKFSALITRQKREVHFAQVLCRSELPVPSNKVRVVVMGSSHVESVIKIIRAPSSDESKRELVRD